MKKKIYVIGHRNPDTDSVVSAAAYARLKQRLGTANCYAARAGNLTPQTEYIFQRFGVPVPEYIPDLIPKASHYLNGKATTVDEGLSLWEAIEVMQNENLRVLPIVDREGRYKSVLHYREFARYIITHINPNQKSSFMVSMAHLVKILRAAPVTLFDAEEVKKSSVIIAAAYNRFFISHLEQQNPENALVIMGDRLDLQRYSIERGVRALILSNGHSLDEDLADLARKHRVSVISSPYDTPSTAMLIMYSAPVGTMGDDTVPLVRLNDPVRNLKGPLSRAPSRGLPVGDDQGRVAGVLFEGSLIEEPNIEIIMVDHNEPSQAIEGIENYRVLEVIDHHRLGNLSTRYPITFINKVVGATCTIIANLYREQKIEPEKDMASILLCGILTDTLSLQSATTTAVDREAADYLSSLAGLDIQKLGRDLLQAANRANDRPAEELILLDMKEYTEQEVSFSVSQIETDNPSALQARREEILGVLEKTASAKGYLFAALLVTDVTVLDSLLYIRGRESFISGLSFPRLEKDIFVLKDVVSRKKQLIPLLSELVEQAR
ncbi:MAG: putative manganese-dependent inorganic diphosphatase [Treponema sp.]|jgi:manganese-dependent inorganic pyrophosphatase|nr:putative manganese-dependent inorganic diphosphatase [Treponema sp.]